MEKWRTIKQAPNYAVSDLGRVKRITSGKRTRPGLIRSQWFQRGYAYVTLRIGIKNRGFQVHRLVAGAFLGRSKKQVNHKNGKRGDNRVENLEYLSAKDNQRHSRDVLGTFIMGSRHHQAKLTEDNVREIFALRKLGMNGKVLAKRFHVSDVMIYYILNRKWWKHVEIQ